MSDYFETFCTLCGATDDQNDAVTVTRIQRGNMETNPSLTIQDDQEVTFTCDNCDVKETVQTGIYPEGHTDYFESRVKPDGEPTTLRINEQVVQYRDIDEQIVESALINHDDIRTSRMHHLHVHALNPPTFTTGSAHHIEIEGYLEQRMMLGDIRYHDSKVRTLKFFRKLDGGIIDKVTGLTETDTDSPD